MGGPKQAGWDHFVQQKMVLGPNQAAIFSPAGPKMLPDLVLGPFLARTKTAVTVHTKVTAKSQEKH